MPPRDRKVAHAGKFAACYEQPSLSRCKTPKVVFDVDVSATKPEIAQAIEEIYAERNVKVVSVNTVSIKSKQRRVTGFLGQLLPLEKKRS